MGILAAMQSLQRRAAQPVLHLRSPNPHLLASLPPAALGDLLSMPRQASGRPTSSADTPAATGVSSFAFQGTNAHILLLPSAPAASPSHGNPSSAAPYSSASFNPNQHDAASALWDRRFLFVLPPSHALLRRALPTPTVSSAAVFEVALAHPAAAFLWQHVVNGRAIFPGAGYLELAAAAVEILLSPAAAASPTPGMGTALVNVAILAPLLLPAAALAGSVRLCVRVALATGTCSVESAGAAAATVHIHAGLQRMEQPADAADLTSAPSDSQAGRTVQAGSLDRAHAAASVPVSTCDLYRDLAAAALQYGPGFRNLRGVKHASGNGGSATGAVQLPISQLPGSFLVGPAVLDNALQLGAAIRPADSNGRGSSATYVPASVGLFYVARRLAVGSASKVQAVAERTPGVEDSSAALSRDLRLICAGDGSVAVTVRALVSRAIGSVGRGAAAAAATASNAVSPMPEPEQPMYEVQWLAAGQCEPVKVLPSDNLSASLRLVSHSSSSSSLTLAVSGALAAAQSSLRYGLTSMVLSSTAGAYGKAAAWGPAAASGTVAGYGLQGFLRTVAQEASSMLIDSQQTDAQQVTGTGLSLQLGGISQPPCLFDGYGTGAAGGARFEPRLLPATSAEATPGPYHLVPLPRGALSSLTAVPTAGAGLYDPLPAGASLLAVKAVGVNFRDVLNVLGMYPGDPGDPGGDCAGMVLRCSSSNSSSSMSTGSSVQAGERVFGLAAGCLGSHVVASSLAMVPMPPTVSSEAAATAPTVFITVDAVLIQAAAMRRGEILMVPAAAGGVGLAAVQMAAAMGALTFATAGGPTKRALLRTLGVGHVASSRDLEFVEVAAVALAQQQLKQQQAGAVAVLGSGSSGANVVLNTLTSPGLVAAALATLQTGGLLGMYSAVLVLRARMS